jgi:diguanylate cyclase (GGDEF)-like protein
MNKITSFSMEHKSILLYLICCVLHITGGFFFFHYGFIYSAIYNFAVGIIYLFLLYILSNLPETFLLSFMIIEVLAYSLLVSIETGNDAGTLLLDLNLASITFIVMRDTKRIKWYYYSVSCMILTVICVILYLDFTRSPSAVILFYKLNFSACLLSTTVLIMYIAGIAEAHIICDRQKQTARECRLNFMANHDSLTGILNRRELNRLLHEHEVLKNEKNIDYAFAIFDIDKFKQFNDSYGHDAGDFILKEMTKFVSEHIPPGAYFARWGGEEFAILFTVQVESAPDILSFFRDTIGRERFTYNMIHELHITLTFGLSTSFTGKGLHEMLIAADDNLMYGKRNGRNCIVTGKNEIYRAERQ